MRKLDGVSMFVSTIVLLSLVAKGSLSPFGFMITISIALIVWQTIITLMNNYKKDACND